MVTENQTEQQKDLVPEAMAKVVCNGITSKQAFTVYPVGQPAYYAEFLPGVPVSIPESVAKELVRLEPSRFQIVEQEPAVAADQPQEAKPEAIGDKGGVKRGKNKR